MALYVVTPNLDKLPKDAKSRLIRAKTKAGALAFAVSNFYTAEPATTENAFELAQAGCKIEDAEGKS